MRCWWACRGSPRPGSPRRLGVVLGLAQKRVQFTPDLMPADILGSEVLDEAGTGRQSFRFIPGRSSPSC